MTRRVSVKGCSKMRRFLVKECSKKRKKEETYDREGSENSGVEKVGDDTTDTKKRRFSVKGCSKKRKKKETYDREGSENSGVEKVGDDTTEKVVEDSVDELPKGCTKKRRFSVKGCSKKRKKEETYDREDSENSKVGDDTTEKVVENSVDELPGLPIAADIEKKKSGVIFILEKASLEVAKVGKSYQILSSEDHSNFLRKNNKNPGDYRPDIIYQVLLTILDSPLNMAGRVQAIYVQTEKGVLFEVKPCVRIPRTIKRFSGIMLQLVQKLSISAAGKREKLLRVIKNPVTQYLPANSRKIGFSFSSEKLVNMKDYVRSVNDDTTLVFMIGAMAHGKIQKEEADDFISISEYPMSAAWCSMIVANAMAEKWKIL